MNSRPHLGHLIGSVLPPDIYTKYLHLRGETAIYICGTDEHGTATELAAEKAGVDPAKWCEKFHHLHYEDYKWFNINFTNFGRTSAPSNHELTQHIFKKLHAKKYIFEKDVEQLYCKKCKRFLSDRYVKGTCECGEQTNADQCDSCGKLQETKEIQKPKCVVCNGDATLKTSKHLFLDLPKFKDWLVPWIEKNKHWPNNVRNWALSLAKEVKPRCITRDLKWGVKVPLKGFEDKVFYVWFDAPIGYISITKDASPKKLLNIDWHDWWTQKDTRLVHFLGKDNIPFHTVIFPSMLHGTKEYIVPYNVIGAEYLNYEGKKFSKSTGVGVTLEDARKLSFTPDQWRYALVQMAPESHDTDFTWKDFQKAVNELADVLGNFVHRTCVLDHKFFDGEVPHAKDWEDADKELIKKIEAAPAEVAKLYDTAHFKEASKKALELVRDCNAYLNAQEPWKSDNKENTIFLCLNACRTVAILLHPIIPSASKSILDTLNVKSEKWDTAGKLLLPGGHKIEESKPMFEKLEDVSVYEKKFGGKGDFVKYEDFEKMDIRVVTVKKAEKIEGADKLLKLTVADGDGSRTLVAGIAKDYKPADLEGKQVPILANLEPRKMRGIESQGMILCAEVDGKGVLLLPDKKIPEGTKVC